MHPLTIASRARIFPIRPRTTVRVRARSPTVDPGAHATGANFVIGGSLTTMQAAPKPGR
jgi:hypothetical protein